MNGRDHSMRIGLVLLALINMLPAIEADESWGVLAIAAVAGLIAALPVRSGGAARVPSALVYLCVFLSIAYLIWEMFGSHPGGTVYVLDLAHFMIFLCACKFLEMRTNRDMGLIAVIAFLVLVIGAFVSGSLLFALAIAVDVTLGAWWMLIFHMKRERDAIALRQARLLVTHPAAEPPSPMPGRSPALYRPASVLAIGLLATTAVLFVAVPRGWGRSMLGGIQRALPTNLTGFTDDVTLSDTPLIENDTPVMRARFTKNDKLVGGSDFQPYMRGATFDEYREARWRLTPQGRSPPAEVENKGRKRAGPKQAPAELAASRMRFRSSEIIQQEIWLERTDGNSLFALYPPLALGSESIEAVTYNPRDRTMKLVNRSRGAINYVVESPDNLDRRRAAALDAEDQSLNAWRPPRTMFPHAAYSLATGIASRIGDPKKNPALREPIADAFRVFLGSGDFRYSLDPGGGRDSNTDPIEHFLTRSKCGHCEYFASSMALMCQSIGIPARLVTGFYGGEYNPVGGFYQFRAKDAHAWVEVEVPDKGWVAFDPSPPSAERRAGVDLSLWSELRRLADYLQFEWSTFVVAFDSDHRQELVAGFATWLDSLQAEAHGPAFYWSTAKSFLWGPSFLTMGQRALYWSFLALCISFAVLLLRVLWILLLMVREYLPIQRREGPRLVRRPEARFYDRLAVLLAHKGHTRPAYRTPREFADQLAGRFTDLADLAQITEWFYAAQFGQAALDDTQRERVREFSRRLREEPSFGTRPTRAKP